MDVIHAITGVIGSFLTSLNVQPSHYGFMFPPEIEPAKITAMVDEGVFPTLTGLAPALTYALLLSLARYVLHFILFKVSGFVFCGLSKDRIDQHFSHT